jgi:hypothetical protein
MTHPFVMMCRLLFRARVWAGVNRLSCTASCPGLRQSPCCLDFFVNGTCHTLPLLVSTNLTGMGVRTGNDGSTESPVEVPVSWIDSAMPWLYVSHPVPSSPFAAKRQNTVSFVVFDNGIFPHGSDSCVHVDHLLSWH